jgi:phosphatidylglycerophosphate synthase
MQTSSNEEEKPANRRPMGLRDTQWAAVVTSFLASRRMKPNWLSLSSVGFSIAATALFASLPGADAKWQQLGLLATGAACVLLRGFCNLFDGMIAVEGGHKTLSGEIFNDFPDRLSDPLTLIGVGYCAGSAGAGPVLGGIAALLALLTAYTRVLGAAAGAKHCFLGPMAKTHRMAVIIAAALLSGFESAAEFQGLAFKCGLSVIIVGCIVTVIRRLRVIVGELEHGA